MKSKNHCESTKGADSKCMLPPAKDQWSVDTPYLKQLKGVNRARARRAVNWRPLFLTALTMCPNYTFALKAAGICYNTFRAHERNDPDFADQVREAQRQGIDLLHARCWAAAVEGNLEPVYWQGKVVGHIPKYDTRLQIEMLRAYMPERFKTPGQAQVTVNTGPSLLVLTEEDRAKLIQARREALALMPGSDDDSPGTTCARSTPNT